MADEADHFDEVLAVVCLADKRTMLEHAMKQTITPHILCHVGGSHPMVIPMAAVKMACDGCHTAADTGPASLIPAMNPA